MYIIGSLTCLWVPLCQSGAPDWGWTAGHRREEMTAWQRSGRAAPLHSLDPRSVPLWDLCRHIHIVHIVDYSIPSPANASVPKWYGNPMLTYIQIFLQPVVDVHVKRFVLDQLPCNYTTPLLARGWPMKDQCMVYVPHITGKCQPSSGPTNVFKGSDRHRQRRVRWYIGKTSWYWSYFYEFLIVHYLVLNLRWIIWGVGGVMLLQTLHPGLDAAQTLVQGQPLKYFIIMWWMSSIIMRAQD